MKRTVLILALLLFIPVILKAQGQQITAGPFSKGGLLYVCPVPSGGTPCPSPSSIFSDVALTQPLSNPIAMSAQVAITFYAASGQYTLEMPASGVQQVVGGGGVTSVPGTYSASSDPPMVQNYTVTTTGRQTAVNLTAAPIDTHTIQWRTIGTVTACTITLDTSQGATVGGGVPGPTDSSWSVGGGIASQSCLPPASASDKGSQASVSSIIANYVAPNVTMTGTGSVIVTYAGRLLNPVPAGPTNQQTIAFGTENNSVTTGQGGNQTFIFQRPFIANYVATSGSMFINPPTGFAVHILTATNTQIRAGTGFLHTMTVNGGTLGAVTIVDTSAANCTGGTTIFGPATPVSTTYTFDYNYVNGLCVTTAAATDLTVSHSTGTQFQCLVQPQFSKGGPPRYTGTGTDVPVGLPTYSIAQFSGVLHDPNSQTVHGAGNADTFHSIILKAYQGATGPTMFPAVSLNTALNGYQINAGDWLNIHQDCNVPPGMTGDVEAQITFQGYTGPIPKYVQWFADTATRANESPLCFNGGQTQCWWFKNTASPGTLQIVSNTIEAVTASTTGIYYFNVATGGSNLSPPLSPSGTSDQYGEFTVTTSNASCVGACNAGIALRWSTSALSGYVIGLTGQAGSSASWFIFKDVAGVVTTLTSGTGNIPVGSIVRGEVQGSTLTAKVCTVSGVNPACTTLGSITDATFTSGQVGIYLSPSATIADNQISSVDFGNLNF